MKRETSFERRRRRMRHKIKVQSDRPRLCVFRSNMHIYAQVISVDGSKTLISASTNEKGMDLKPSISGSKQGAKLVGQTIAERAIKHGIKQVVFDRSGYIFHGRVRELADAARESGLDF